MKQNRTRGSLQSAIKQLKALLQRRPSILYTHEYDCPTKKPRASVNGYWHTYKNHVHRRKTRPHSGKDFERKLTTQEADEKNWHSITLLRTIMIHAQPSGTIDNRSTVGFRGRTGLRLTCVNLPSPTICTAHSESKLSIWRRSARMFIRAFRVSSVILHEIY